MKAEQRSRFLSSHKFWGLIVILPLLFTFITGSFAFVRNDFMVWAQPELATVKNVDLNAIKTLSLRTDPGITGVAISLPSYEDSRIRVWNSGGEEKSNAYIYNPQTQTFDTEAIVWSRFLKALHYYRFFPKPYSTLAYYFLGFISIAFFMLMYSGSIYLWKVLRKELKVPKEKRGSLNFWAKWHRFTSLITIPVQLIYAFTGAFWPLGLLVAGPMAALVFFGGSIDELQKAVFPKEVEVATDKSSAALSLNELYRKAQEHLGESTYITSLHSEKKEGLWPTASFHTEMNSASLVRRGEIVLAANGTVVHEVKPGDDLATSGREVESRLHYGTVFGLKFKYFMMFLALLTSYSLACGLNTWLSKTRSTKKRFWYPVMKIGGITVIAGAFVAMAIGLHMTFYSSSQAPAAFWYGLLFSAILACPFNARKSYRLLFSIATVLWISLPVHQYLVNTGVVHGDYAAEVILRVNVLAVSLAVVFALFVWEPRFISWFERGPKKVKKEQGKVAEAELEEV
ncbi:MAG: PepSY domain-containing protein [Lentisphaeraceae bacterium]|nr:PepSY domain-containing protein [Lentisphaeraceae bacterium]